MAGRKTPTTPTRTDRPDVPTGRDCDIEIDCDLVGIQPAVLTTVREGDLLTVRLDDAASYRSVVCVTSSGQILGAIANVPGQTNLIACLSRSLRYAVQIRELGAGRCRVRGGLVR